MEKVLTKLFNPQGWWHITRFLLGREDHVYSVVRIVMHEDKGLMLLVSQGAINEGLVVISTLDEFNEVAGLGGDD